MIIYIRPNTNNVMTINEKLSTIQTKFKSKKSRFNSFGKYNFRSAEDILEATKPYLLELGVSVTINETLINSQPMPILESKATISDGENHVSATALVGVDLLQKGMQTPQQFGSASSYGKKYSLGNSCYNPNLLQLLHWCYKCMQDNIRMNFEHQQCYR